MNIPTKSIMKRFKYLINFIITLFDKAILIKVRSIWYIEPNIPKPIKHAIKIYISVIQKNKFLKLNKLKIISKNNTIEFDN